VVVIDYVIGLISGQTQMVRLCSHCDTDRQQIASLGALCNLLPASELGLG